MIEPTREPAPVDPGTTPAPGPGPGTTAPTPPLAVSNARSLEEYKAEVAHAILHANAS